MIKYNNYDFQKFYEKYSKLEAINLLELMIKKVFHKKIAVTSSFGAESVVILDLISVLGIDRSIAMDLHSPQIQGFVNTPFDHLYSSMALFNRLKNFPVPIISYITRSIFFFPCTALKSD